MDILTERKIQYFTKFDEDLVENANQNYQLPTNFQWIRNDLKFKFLSNAISVLAKGFGYGFNKLILKQSFANKAILEPYKHKGYFLYANHTQPVGDVFLPMLAGTARRYYVVCAQSNLGMPIIGPLLPYGGALPIPSDLHQLPRLIKAVQCHIERNDFVTIYPEAHVWPYYTGIRPFSKAAFHFPMKVNVPSFVMTNTYQRCKWSKRPKMVTYLDGPFYPQRNLPAKQAQEQLMQQVKTTMQKRAQLNDAEYIRYVQRKDGKNA